MCACACFTKYRYADDCFRHFHQLHRPFMAFFSLLGEEIFSSFFVCVICILFTVGLFLFPNRRKAAPLEEIASFISTRSPVGIKTPSEMIAKTRELAVVASDWLRIETVGDTEFLQVGLMRLQSFIFEKRQNNCGYL